jgi:hypothetical protein
MKNTLLAICACAAAVGCATPPATYSVSNSRTYDKSYDQVWESLVAFLATNNIQVKNIAKDSGVVYAERASFDATMADCGSPGLMIPEAKRATFNVFVTHTTAKPTVSVNATFEEVRRFDRTVQTVTCNSRGLLESRILDAIGR